MWLIECCQKHFWYKKYNDFGQSVLDNLNKEALVYTCIYTILVYVTAVIYLLSPIMGKSSQRKALHRSTIEYFVLCVINQMLSSVHEGVRVNNTT